jgi:hypothetical protein
MGKKLNFCLLDFFPLLLAPQLPPVPTLSSSLSLPPSYSDSIHNAEFKNNAELTDETQARTTEVQNYSQTPWPLDHGLQL